MLGFGRDKGEKRTFESLDTFAVGSSGKLHRADSQDAIADMYQLIADDFHTLGDEFDLRAQAARNHRTTTIDAKAFNAMVSGS